MQAAFQLLGLLLGLSALFGWINARFLRLPTTVGLVVIALAVSLAILALDAVVPAWGLGPTARRLLEDIDFNETLMRGVLSFLLFAGALHVNLNALLDRKWAILIMATAGVLISTALIGGGLWVGLGLLGAPVPLLYCLIFGSLIAPTDPVAVLGILKRVHVPRSLEAKIAGESLFNDGVGVVVFTILVALATGAIGHDGQVDAAAVIVLFLREAVGGAVLGLAAGAIAFYGLRSVDEYPLEIIMTLALVTLTYGAAGVIHVSGPIAVVVAGLLIGNHGRRLAMSETTREHLSNFWSLLDEILNSLLFLLIGFEVLAVTAETSYLLHAALAIPIVLLARLVSVGLPIRLLAVRRRFTPGAVWVLTWGGLRGGISVALALSLPANPWTAEILTLCYGVVIFSVIVQGLSVEWVIRRVVTADSGADERPGDV